MVSSRAEDLANGCENCKWVKRLSDHAQPWPGMAPLLCPQALIGKCFVFSLPYGRDQPCCLLHTCENSRFFALLTSRSSILDGHYEQNPGESHPTCARKFFTRSEQPSSCLPLLSSCTPADPACPPHTFRWETQWEERHKPLQFSFWCFPPGSILSSLHHILQFANSCSKAWGQNYDGAIKSTAGLASTGAVCLSFLLLFASSRRRL